MSKGQALIVRLRDGGGICVADRKEFPQVVDLFSFKGEGVELLFTAGLGLLSTGRKQDTTCTDMPVLHETLHSDPEENVHLELQSCLPCIMLYVSVGRPNVVPVHAP